MLTEVSAVAQDALLLKDSPLEKKQMFYAKAGLALNKISFYDADYGMMGNNRRFLEERKRGFKLGEALDIGYSHYIKDTRFYWAAELGLTTQRMLL